MSITRASICTATTFGRKKREKNKWYRFKFKTTSRQRTTKNVAIYLLEKKGKFQPLHVCNYIDILIHLPFMFHRYSGYLKSTV